MPRRSFITIAGIIVFSFLVVIILLGISDEPISYNQNFTRLFKHDVVQQRNVMDLKDNSYYIAGVTTNHIYFGNENDSLDLVITDTLLSSVDHVRLNVTKEKNLILKNSYIEIDSPFFYIKAGDLPGIFKGELDRWEASRILNHAPYFTRAVSITENTFALQVTGSAEGSTVSQNILCKASPDTLRDASNAIILEGKVDNYFSTLGVLRYSKDINRLVYTYFFRNQYMVMDTSLNLLYKANTLDTVSHAQLKPVEVEERTYTVASTDATVNTNAQVMGNWLFIHSNLMAINESKEAFDNVSVIDVYDLETTKYQFSFYLPDYHKTKMKTFKVFGKRLVALYDRYAVSFSLTKTPVVMPKL